MRNKKVNENIGSKFFRKNNSSDGYSLLDKKLRNLTPVYNEKKLAPKSNKHSLSISHNQNNRLFAATLATSFSFHYYSNSNTSKYEIVRLKRN